MDINIILRWVKARAGFTANTRDEYLMAVISSVLAELDKVNGLILDPDRQDHVIFVADFAFWRYQSRDASGAMPEHMRWRLNNLIVKNGEAV